MAALDQVERFYTQTMRGRVRRDGPGARLKFTRDWEYPWAFLRAGAAPGAAILDCGAGNSPLVYLWAERGARVTAIDRDAVVAGRIGYLGWCARSAFTGLARRGQAAGAAGRTRARAEAEVAGVPAGARPAHGMHRPGHSAARSGTAAARLARFLKTHWRQNRDRLRRVIKPDFWGPVSPRLLRQYGVTYERGDLTALPLADASFDAVTCISVLEHMPREARLAGLGEMARVTKPGGRLIVTYDLIDGDITEELVASSGCQPVELVYFEAARRLYAPHGADVVGLLLER
jgi:SAM-dependent methyltransferase